MATSFKKTYIRNIPRLGEVTNEDSIYWKHLQFPVTRKVTGAVTHVEFCQVEPFPYAVTNSTKVEICSSKTNNPIKTVTRFQQEAFSGSFRHDGQLLVAGGDEGIIRLFELKNKNMLRKIRAHHRPVHWTRFLADGKAVVSAGDDCMVKVFDIGTAEETMSLKLHQDYIRTGAVCPSNPEIIFTGSYDHSVQMVDLRLSQSVQTIQHGSPVECVAVGPGGGLVCTAGDTVVKLWDVLGGCRLLATLSNHHKTVTSVCINGSHLLTAGLDRHVKIYDLASLTVSRTVDYTGALLCMAIAPDDSVLLAGQSDGYLVARPRVEPKTEKRAPAIERTERVVLDKHENMLKTFNHSKSLDSLLSNNKIKSSPDVIFSGIQELMRRDCLNIALAGRDEQWLLKFLRILHKFINNSSYISICIDIMSMLLDLYKNEFSSNSQLKAEVTKINELVVKELSVIRGFTELTGIVETLLRTQNIPDHTAPVENNSMEFE